jgi:drug/metabolite transporter (DMT)-like permease
VIAVLGGLGAAVCFTISALCASASSRAIGAQSTLAWVMLIGLVLILPPTVLLADPAQLTWPTVGLLAVAGASGVAGLLIEYMAFRRGKVGVVTGIASTEGMVAALISAAAGARLHARTGLLLALVTVGVAVTAASPDAASPDDGPPDADPGGPGGRTVRAAVLALPVALLFGLTLYTTGRIGARASVLWALLPARLFGSVLLAAPLAARRKLRLTRRALPLVAAAGAAEVLGTLSYAVGARHQLAIAAVLASQFAALTAVAAFILHGQRLTRAQLAGLAAVVIGVSLVSALGQ